MVYRLSCGKILKLQASVLSLALRKQVHYAKSHYADYPSQPALLSNACGQRQPRRHIAVMVAERIKSLVANAFYKHGQFCSAHPWPVITFVCAVILIAR